MTNTGPTYGFENHVPSKAQVFDTDSNACIVAFSEEGDSEIALLVYGPGADPVRIRVRLNRREAIYLRNRLTAFIEDGLDTIPSEQ